jgi:hypothetical protein
MAEAHSAVAFSFSVTPEGVNVKLNHEALRAVWRSGVRSFKKRVGRMQVSNKNWLLHRLLCKIKCSYTCTWHTLSSFKTAFPQNR